MNTSFQRIALRRFSVKDTIKWHPHNYRRLHQIPFTPKKPAFKAYKMNSAATMDPEQPESTSPLPQPLQELIKQSMKYKERSHKTLEEVHKPGLELIPPTFDTQTPNQTSSFDVIFIGDSMLERLKSTGQNTGLHNLPRSFNLGVGGDKIENVLYRLHTGYIPLLADRPTKLWVVHIGTNNLRPKKGLRDSDPSDYANFRILIETLRVLCPGSKVLVTGLFPRKDVSDELVRASNEKMKETLDELDRTSLMVSGSFAEPGPGVGRLFWMDPTENINTDVLVDHVHLNEDGYTLWDESLYPRILEILALEEAGPLQGAD
ncbi:hypothetical protein TWF225_003832 [Orbilia oligospora]|uniref:SGNH hydrolase-type esterase domain-containing protein n=1 Tax=Orbilia oligospora TaxID=2813651 RepID=A0A8H2DQL8_ORBOL|nr:hypothetical protein TWF225_003832 [Orbilia oligospora]KAF3248555.1 hypothetical protein TWF128_008279 [Orbilia oligospora]KAF3258603.1 hypothetical protein TWF217_005378 [Orbilia oligospora]KAF3295470.1 hypothetical protein TWF132_001517 [Orbilia oligospora]TGJ64541.1 hypothetical protein EYR41_010589 [Orbilia oligospora]